MSNKKGKIKYIKQSYDWNFISDYLSMLCQTMLMKDEKYNRLFDNLFEYVYSKIEIPRSKEIAKISVLIEQEVDEEI